MATSPIPTPTGVAITTDIGKIAEAVTAVCAVLQTAEGQAAMKAWRENAATFNEALVKAAATIDGWFK